MAVIIWFLLSSAAAFMAVRDLSARKPAFRRRIPAVFSIFLSVSAGYIIARAILLNAEADTPEGIMAEMQYNLAIAAVLVPNTVFAVFHFTGRLIRFRNKMPFSLLSAAGATAGTVLFLAMMYGHFIGRFNFRYEQVTIEITGLHPDLNDVRIVHISDLHLGSFHGSTGKISDVVATINSFNPHLIVNTGDFITLGHREYGRFDTLLVKMEALHGNYAVLGNHDIGTYLPGNISENKEITIRKVSEMVNASGYTILDQTNSLIQIGGATLALAGIETRGRHPVMIHPETDSALRGTENADLVVLLSHDPNHWDKILEGPNRVDLTLSGHTHGMQFGVLAGRFRWSPAKYAYPRWHGLYREGDRQLYVNRGLGVLGIPVRIGMPPEITVITLRSER